MADDASATFNSILKPLTELWPIVCLYYIKLKAKGLLGLINSSNGYALANLVTT